MSADLDKVAPLSLGVFLTNQIDIFHDQMDSIYYILDEIFFFFYRSDLRIEDLTGYKNMTR